MLPSIAHDLIDIRVVADAARLWCAAADFKPAVGKATSNASCDNHPALHQRVLGP